MATTINWTFSWTNRVHGQLRQLTSRLPLKINGECKADVEGGVAVYGAACPPCENRGLCRVFIAAKVARCSGGGFYSQQDSEA